MALVLNQNSWLVRWVSWFSSDFESRVYHNNVDSCSLIGAMIKSLIWTAIFAALISFLVASMILAPLYALYVWLFTYPGDFTSFRRVWMEAHPFVSFGLGMDMCLLVLFAIGVLTSYISGWIKRRSRFKKEPGTIAILYSSWRDKYCLQINITK